MSIYSKDIFPPNAPNSLNFKIFSNILPSFMTSAPKNSPLFSTKSLSSKEILLISQIISNCSICLKKMKKPCKLDSCDHIFCLACINKMTKFSDKCPMCRSKFEYVINIINK